MRGVAVLGLALAALVACTSGTAGGSGNGTSLRITYWEDGVGEPDSVWTLRCNPARGTLARPLRACRKLAADTRSLFAMTPRDAVCTQIYGGPQRARIVGRVRGAPVWTTVSRTDGCEIGRWQLLSPWLLPPGGVS